MKSLVTCLSTFLLLGASATAARAQYPFPVRPLPVYCPAPPLHAPDMCGPGFYAANWYGQYYGPSYNVTPPFAPFQGMMPLPGCPGSPAAMQQQQQQQQLMQARFPSHPFARSPRDFFMVD